MVNYKKIEKARKILGLGEKATIPEIKDAFRKLSLKYHPDKCAGSDTKKCEEKFKEINNANETLIEYCLNYQIFFNAKETAAVEQDKDRKDHLRRFYDGWWGELKSE